MSIFGRAEAGTKGTLQLVQRGTDKRIPVELVKQPSGEVLDPTELEGLHVMVSSKSGSWCATIPYTIEDNKLVVEVTADISQQLGLGVYTMTATGRIPDPAYADGYHDYEVVVDLCKVTKYGSNETPVKVDAKVIEGLRGLNNYQLAVKHGYKGTEEEWLKTLKGESGDDAYEVAKKSGYIGSREEWLKTLIGATGLSAYELAKADGYMGSLGEWIASLKGDKGDSAYEVAVSNGYVGDEQTWVASLRGSDGKDAYEVAKAGGYRGSREEWIASLKGDPGKDIYQLAVEDGYKGSRKDYLASQKGDTGKSAYQHYLDTTDDKIKLTEKQWANANDFFYQFLFRILKGAGVKPTETDMTADQVYELDRQRREIIEALRHHGVDINEGDGLSTVATKLAEIHAPVIVIHKEQQMLDWLIEESPTIKIYDGYSPASLRYTFGRCYKLRRIPDIIGASAVTDVSYICASCASMVSATLPDLPLVTTAGSAFSGCSSLTSLTIGDVPKCRTFSSLATGCAALQTLEIGNASSAEDISLIAVNCGSLTTVKVSFGNQVNNAQMAFFSCSALQRIDGELDLSTATNVSSTFGGCSSLEEVRIKGLKVDLDLSACANISVESVKYLVDNLQQATGKSIALSRAWQQAHTAESREYAKIAAQKGFSLSFR
nr:MAG TPA: tail sheath protein [Caudoviricetes sp.]